jgi:hypothetical protein
VREFRLLSRAEIESIPGIVDPIPKSLFAVGMVDEQGVAAAIGVFLVLHADPIWIRPDKRNAGKLLLGLWNATKAEILRGQMGPEVLVVGMTDNVPGQPIEDLIERLCLTAGGNEVKARFFVIPVQE